MKKTSLMFLGSGGQKYAKISLAKGKKKRALNPLPQKLKHMHARLL